MKNAGRRSLPFTLLVFVSFLGAKVSGASHTTVNGEVVETYCWAVHQVGGAGHAQCGIECAKRGLPVALYDPKSRTGYILLPARDKMSLPAALVAAMGQRVTIDGELAPRGGIPFLIVQSLRLDAARH